MRNVSKKNAERYRECMSMLDRPLIECNKEMLQKAERMIKEYLDEGFPPDFRISRSRKPELKYNTLLHKALTIRPWDPDIKYKLPDTLLDHGADPNITDAWGWNGLMTALLFNQPRKLVERIFQYTDNLDHCIDNGKIAIEIAYDSFIIFEDDEDDGFYVEEAIEGISIDEILPQIQYKSEYVSRLMKKQIDAAVKADRIKPREGVKLMAHYNEVLKSKTYLS